MKAGLSDSRLPSKGRVRDQDNPMASVHAARHANAKLLELMVRSAQGGQPDQSVSFESFALGEFSFTEMLSHTVPPA